MTVTEIMARAIFRQHGLDPNTLYEHHEWEEWPIDERRKFIDAFSGEPRTSLMHRGWRKRTAHAEAAIAALTEAGFAIVPLEPTPEMIEAATDEIVVGCCSMDAKNARDTYRAMLATAAAV